MNRRPAIHRTRKDVATEGGAEQGRFPDGPSDRTMQPLASSERRALASQHRRHRRDLMKRRGASSKRSALVVRDHLPAVFPRTSSSSPLNHAAEGTPTLAPPGAACEAPAVSPEVWQLRQEIAILRQQLNSRDSCSKVEAPAQDQMPQPAVDWEGMNVNRAMAPGGQLANVMYKTEGDPELQGSSDNSAGTCHDASPTAALPEQGFHMDSMDQTLWVAANRPIRPKGWAATPDPTSPAPVFHTDPFSIEGLEGFDSFNGFQDEPLQHFVPPSAHFTSPASHPASNPAPAEPSQATHQQSWFLSQAQQQHQQQHHQTDMPYSNDMAEPSHGHAQYAEPGRFSRASAFGCEDRTHFDAFNHYILPDVPGGCESVDKLAVHVPFWPQLGSPQIAAGEP